MTASDANTLMSASIQDVTSSLLYTYVQSRIAQEAIKGGSYLLDPMAGLDKYVPYEMQTAVWDKLTSESFSVGIVTVPSGSFGISNTIKVSW